MKFTLAIFTFLFVSNSAFAGNTAQVTDLETRKIQWIDRLNNIDSLQRQLSISPNASSYRCKGDCPVVSFLGDCIDFVYVSDDSGNWVRVIVKDRAAFASKLASLTSDFVGYLVNIEADLQRQATKN